jgi:hypothetical protein
MKVNVMAEAMKKIECPLPFNFSVKSHDEKTDRRNGQAACEENPQHGDLGKGDPGDDQAGVKKMKAT